MFLFFKTVYFYLWLFSAKETYAERLEKLSELNNFRVSKTTLSSTLMIRKGFQWYVVKWTSKNGGSLEITFTVPLSRFAFDMFI